MRYYIYMQIAFTKREVFGKKVESLRQQGNTPVVCYGNKEKTESFSVNTKLFKKLLTSEQVVIETSGDLPGKQVLLQDVTYHPVTGSPLHADFLFVDASHEVTHEVPVHIEGEAPGVKTHEGQMVVALDHIEIRALPQNIPGSVTADVNTLETIGTRLLASDIPLPDNVTLVTNPEEIIVSIVEQSQEEEQEPETDEDYLSKIEVTGKGGKKEEEPAEGDDGEKQGEE